MSQIKYKIDAEIAAKARVAIIGDKRAIKQENDANRWDDFRARREIEIDRYIAQKKKQRALEQLIAIS